MRKDVFTFCILFLIVSAITWISIDSVFYEDKIYIHYLTSIVNDFDFNIINQVAPQFGEIVTEKFSYPSHHTVFQTPGLLILSGFQYVFEFMFGHQVIESYKLAGVLWSFLCLLVGFVYVQKAAKFLGVEIYKRHLIFFMFTTSFFYFSFLTLTVLEIFNFALASYVLNGTILLSRKQHVQLFSYTAASLMLLMTKITYFPLVLVGLYFIFNRNEKIPRSFYFASVLVLISGALNDYASFNGLALISRSMNEFTSDYSWLDFYHTIRTGYFGKGGLFYTNPTFAFCFIGVSILLFRLSKDKQNSAFLTAAIGFWFLMGFFQTTFIAGPMLEDHYVGRIVLTTLPIMLMGLAILDSKMHFRWAIHAKIFLFIALSLWQTYTLLNFLTIQELGHYQYATEKTVQHLGQLKDYVVHFIGVNDYIIDQDSTLFFAFILFMTSLLFWSWKRRSRIGGFLDLYIKYSVSLMLLLGIMNFVNSEKNGKEFLRKNNRLEKVTIGNHYSVYSFIYIVDILRSQSANTQDTKLKSEIEKKHRQYLQIVEKHLVQSSHEFETAIKNRDLNYSFFNN